MYGRSSAEPLWQESKMAVRRTPGRRGLTLWMIVSMNWQHRITNVHYFVHLVIDNVSNRPKVDGVDDFIVAIVFVAINVCSLTTMT
jgi:hypothetical protein